MSRKIKIISINSCICVSMYVCMFVCMYVCVNVCMYAYMYIYNIFVCCNQCIYIALSLTLKDIPLYDCVTFG